MQGVDTPEQMGTVLHDVITEQRKILSTVRGRPAGQSPQVFTAYKEVLPAYDTGRIHLPPDITINWPDDDFGYIRRLSNPEERKRTGGSGVYYHDTFWGPPMSYLSLALIDRRPWLAGVLIGCLAYKPQFGLLIPLVLVASGRWRVFAAAVATVL